MFPCWENFCFFSAVFLKFLLAWPEATDPISLMSVPGDILTNLKGFYISSIPEITSHSC